MIIKSDGNVGIGTTNPETGVNGGLDVNEEINIGSGTADYPHNPFVRLDAHGPIRITPESRSGIAALCGLAGIGDDGTIRYNETANVLEYCNGTQWKSISLPEITFVKEEHCWSDTPGDPKTTLFLLTAPQAILCWRAPAAREI